MNFQPLIPFETTGKSQGQDGAVSARADGYRSRLLDILESP